MSVKVDKCPVCDSVDLKIMADLGSFRLKRCAACDLVISDMDNAGVSGDYYNEEYDPLYETYYRDFRNRQFQKALQSIERVEFPGKNVLDLGCSYGWFLKKAKDHGWTAVGIEPSEKVFSVVSEERDIKVYNYGIRDIGKVPGSFDLITMWNVFEHLDDPNKTLKAIYGKLKKGGVLLVCVPDINGLITNISFLVYRLTGGKVRDHLFNLYQMDNPFPHVFHYSRGNLERLLKKNSFEPFMYWGQDIIDTANLDKRIGAYTGANKLKKNFIVFLLKNLCKISKFVKKQDEMVVVARKN